jgi:uncharacterized protein (TIGR03790 family)
MIRGARACVAAIIVCWASPLLAQSGSNVLLVANDRSPESGRVAASYAARRDVPAAQVLHIETATAERISRDDYASQIEAPIRAWLQKHDAEDRILYIVLTRGVPLAITGTVGPSGTMSSVDSELTLLYRRMTGATVSLAGPVENPYFAASADTAFVPFSHANFDIYLVTRLDGFTAQDATALVDRSLEASRDGSIVMVRRAALHPTATDQWLDTTRDRLDAIGAKDRVLFTDGATRPPTPAAGYVSSGSNDPATAVRTPPVTFAPGALAATFVSTDARTMVEPPAAWKPSPAGINYAGSSQSLVGDLVRAGVTGIAGQVSEPYLAGTIRPDRLFPGYLSGLNLAEAFYRSVPSLSWQTIVIGDPLCAPFRTQGISEAEASPALAPETELPAYFSQRRLAHEDAKDVYAATLLRAQARDVKGDHAGAIAALEQAIAGGANTLSVWRALGELRGNAERYADAAVAYDHALALAPDDVVVLNNLSYLRGVHLHQPEVARPMAERAFKLSNGSPIVADTLAWIRHLSGDDAEAMPLIDSARAALPGNADVQLHAAVLYAAAGRVQDARSALKAAAAANVAIVKTDEYIGVERKLASGRWP